MLARTLFLAVSVLSLLDECRSFSWKSVSCNITRPEKADFDYYLMVQQYGEGVCYSGVVKGQCQLPSKKASLWTVHGLWPTKTGTTTPNYCQGSATFNIDEIKDLVSQMELDWPSMLKGGTLDFWAHEWCKHGTCAAAAVPSLDSELKYFGSVLKIYQQLNIQNLLNSVGISPSNQTQYKTEDFVNAFLSNTGPKVKPLLECKYLKETDQQVLYQISICYSQSFKPIECDESVFTGHKQTICWSDEPVYYYTRPS